MLQKLVCACLCVMLLLSGYGASAKEELPHGTLTVEKTFKKDGLQFQVSLSNITNSVEESTLFKINTK
ncbi:MAG: hypothetical protein K0R47_4191, partial [Brevibacillus sp.]|nr:hypothetical protein [Brevibacillus sp.]